MKSYFVYILTNYTDSVLYVGVTSNLVKRVWEHKNKLVNGFTYKYNINKLVYYEILKDASSAIAREKKIKGWLRVKKINLIIKNNPQYLDLYGGIVK